MVPELAVNEKRSGRPAHYLDFLYQVYRVRRHIP